MWSQLEPTGPHLSYLIFSGFLITYAIFSHFIRNHLHLSEPPLALLTGIIFGPKCANVIDPISWGLVDGTIQETTRLIVGLQVFVIGLELPKRYLKKNWRSVAMMLGPVMAFGWVACAAFILLIFKTNIPTALVISACLTPTDPVLAASVIGESRFSSRVPKRIKDLLSAESGCNDGVSFPFLYLGLQWLVEHKASSAAKEYILVSLLWQCVFGTILGAFLGVVSNKVLRFADRQKFISEPSFLAFYLLLAVLSIGIASTLGVDDFLVAFSCGAAFGYDGWIKKRLLKSNLNNILDLVVNSGFFIFLGSAIPWNHFSARAVTPNVTPGKLVGLLILILLFRRIPIVLATKRFIPGVKTWSEAWFCGHFGPMGVGAIFLAIEARAQLETGTSDPLPHPKPGSEHIRPIELIWPIVAFVVFGSTIIHGLSVTAMSLYIHFARHPDKRADTPGGEDEPLSGMLHEDDNDDSDLDSDTGSEDQNGAGGQTRNGRIALP